MLERNFFHDGVRQRAGDGCGDKRGFTVTVKSVNHRFLDLHLRLPSQCDALEIQMRRVLKERLRRGHMEVTLQLERKAAGAMQVNTDLLAGHVQAYKEAAALYGVVAEPDLNSMLAASGGDGRGEQCGEG